MARADLRIDYEKKTLTAGDTVLKEGDAISIDGSSGEVFAGEVLTAPSEVVQVLVGKSLSPKKSAIYKNYEQLMTWTDKFRKLQVRTNADSPDQVENAIAFGAQGVGLCRTEHMFFEGDRIDAMREMILASTKEDRAAALAKLLPYQREDFVGIFKALKGLPATIRLLDPPLHEFLPHEAGAQKELAAKLKVSIEESPSACMNCMSSTRCWGIAAAASESSTLKFRRCRRARYSKPPPSSRRAA